MKGLATVENFRKKVFDLSVAIVPSAAGAGAGVGATSGAADGLCAASAAGNGRFAVSAVGKDVLAATTVPVALLVGAGGWFGMPILALVGVDGPVLPFLEAGGVPWVSGLPLTFTIFHDTRSDSVSLYTVHRFLKQLK